MSVCACVSVCYGKWFPTDGGNGRRQRTGYVPTTLGDIFLALTGGCDIIIQRKKRNEKEKCAMARNCIRQDRTHGEGMKEKRLRYLNGHLCCKCDEWDE